ncbi:hypothetical protein V8B97DRAFT_2022291 [Scleroderma yunnanense]
MSTLLPSQWLNLVQWKYVDLAKTHVIDEKPIGSIGMAADHITAFTMFIKAIAFVFPQQWDEYLEHQSHLGQLFHSMHFDDLHTTFLSSHGISSHSSESTNQQHEPCHKWNQELCQKPDTDCVYGNHRRPDCNKTRKGQ